MPVNDKGFRELLFLAPVFHIPSFRHRTRCYGSVRLWHVLSYDSADWESSTTLHLFKFLWRSPCNTVLSIRKYLSFLNAAPSMTNGSSAEERLPFQWDQRCRVTCDNNIRGLTAQDKRNIIIALTSLVLRGVIFIVETPPCQRHF